MARCAWCRNSIPPARRSDSRFCSKVCRQAAWRARAIASLEAADRPLRVAYADPPYPGKASYYRDQPSYDGEVDHVALIGHLTSGAYDGWALSTSSAALRDILPLCPPDAHVCAWCKPIGVPIATRGIHSVWEPLIVVQARQARPGRPDWLRAMPARGGGDLVGRKPLAFCHFLFSAVGLAPGDELVDLYPGTGIVSAAWAQVSLLQHRDASLIAGGDASPAAVRDASRTPGRDSKPRA